MSDNIFEKLTDEEQEQLWVCLILDNIIIEKAEEWTKEAEKAGMTLTEYLESINPLNGANKIDVIEDISAGGAGAEMNIGDRVKFKTIGGWYNSGIVRDMNEDSYLIEVDELGCKPPKDVYMPLPYYARVLSCEDINNSGESEDELPTIIEADRSEKYVLKAVTRGNCKLCGKELTEGIFFCKECEDKASRKSEE